MKITKALITIIFSITTISQSALANTDALRTISLASTPEDTREDIETGLSGSFCSQPIPQVASIKEYLTELESRLDLPLADMQIMQTRFVGHMKTALSGVPAAFKMYKSFIGTPIGQETGRYLRLEIGGTNIRISMVELKGNRKYKIHSYEFSSTIPEDRKKGKGAKFFDYIANCIEEFLREYEKKSGHSDVYKLGFILSFPMRKTEICKSTVVELTKEFKLTDVIGKDPVHLLNAALERRHLTNIDVVAMGNDTEALQAGGTYLYEDCTEALILSTGHNISVLTDGDIFNTESGDCNDEYLLKRRTQFDIALDASTAKPGEYMMEEMATGNHLGELTRLILYDLICRGFLFSGQSSPVFSRHEGFKTEYMSQIETVSLKDSAVFLKELLKKLGIRNVTTEDCEIVWKICDMVTTRAAKIVATTLAAAIKKTDLNLERKHKIPVEGSLYEFHPTLKYKIQSALDEIFGEKVSNIVVVLSRDSTKIGAAVMAAIGNSRFVKGRLSALGSPLIFNVTSAPPTEVEVFGYVDFRKDLLRGYGFTPSFFIPYNDHNYFEVWKDHDGQEFILKSDIDKETLAFYLAQALGLDDINKVLLFIMPDRIYASGLRAYGLIEYYDGVTFSTRKPFVEAYSDSELYIQHPELRDLTLGNINFDAWFEILAEPAQIVRLDLFRIFINNADSVQASNLMYKEVGDGKVEIRFIDYDTSFDAKSGFSEEAIISHLEKYASYYLKYCPEFLMNIVNLTDEDIEYIVRWVYRNEVLNVKIGIFSPEKLIENIKRSRDLIRSTLSNEIRQMVTYDKPAAPVNMQDMKAPAANAAVLTAA